MAKYKTKPCEIEAIQWNGTNLEEIKAFVGESLIYDIIDTAWQVGKGRPHVYMKIRTLEGDMEASEGDYIIKGLVGEFYPCKPDVFEKKYVQSNIKTHADAIRNMSDDELAEFFDKATNQDREDWEAIGCFGCVFHGTHHQDKDGGSYECEGCEFENGILAWLQSEVKESDSNAS